jgi:hypothetical protein
MDIKEAKIGKVDAVASESEDPEISKKKFKAEDIGRFETYDDSMPSKQKKGLLGLGSAKNENKESKGLFGNKGKKDKSQDYQELPLKNKNSIFTPKSKPFDDSIETYDGDSMSKKATFIAILVVVGILAVLLLFKSAGVIGYSVKDASNQNSDANGNGKASQKQGIFGFKNIDTVNLSTEPQGTFVSEECLGDINNAETEVAQLEDDVLQKRQGSQANYNEMLQLVKHYQDYYQEKINEQSKDITSAEKDLESAKERLGEMRDKCYAGK